ncbi:hypothetical protein C0995_006323 [Termitomyces sp. Mi166|nr:hypothetical protein C0995_006323 [Termitomyces sp. Mi166\
MLPQFVLDEFLGIPVDTLKENAVNGAWNLLLTTYFPISEGWTVDLAVLFKIEHKRMPAMFVELQPFHKLRGLDARDQVDVQMRNRLKQFSDTAPRTYNGLSAFGHMVRKYELRKAEGNRLLPPRYQGLWDLNLVTDEGGDRIVAIMEAVKNMMLNEGVCKCNFAAPVQ